MAPPSEGAADSPPSVGVFEPFTVRFDLNRQIYNPFDPEFADIRATVVTPAGKNVVSIVMLGAGSITAWAASLESQLNEGKGRA